MPTYDYQCTACRERFSRHESIADHARAGQVTCPKCRSAEVERVISASYPRTPRKS
jgi:putative FmdB family regulatory protein